MESGCIPEGVPEGYGRLRIVVLSTAALSLELNVNFRFSSARRLRGRRQKLREIPVYIAEAEIRDSQAWAG